VLLRWCVAPILIFLRTSSGEIQVSYASHSSKICRVNLAGASPKCYESCWSGRVRCLPETVGTKIGFRKRRILLPKCPFCSHNARQSSGTQVLGTTWCWYTRWAVDCYIGRGKSPNRPVLLCRPRAEYSH
jgi:hypothetical protein